MRNTSGANIINYSVLILRNLLNGRSISELATLPPTPVLQFWLLGTKEVSEKEAEFLYKNKAIKIKGDGAAALAMRAYLMESIYPDVGFNGKDVVDLGANIGGTPIWFSINGARQVFAYEPAPKAYEQMKENIRLNRITNITVENLAVMGKEGKTTIPSDSCSGGNKTGTGDFEVSAITLKAIVEKYNLNDAYLKMNIEGGEYEILNNSDTETLRKFKWIAMEYHHGKENIIKRLEPIGFTISEYVDAKKQPNGMITGRILATRDKYE